MLFMCSNHNISNGISIDCTCCHGLINQHSSQFKLPNIQLFRALDQLALVHISLKDGVHKNLSITGWVISAAAANHENGFAFIILN